jgi:hypothetical protein
VGIIALAIAGWLASLLLAGTTIRLLGQLFTRRGRDLDERIVRVVRGPVRMALTVLVFTIGRRYLGLDLPVQENVRVLERLLWIIAGSWLVFRLIDIGVLGLRIRVERRGNLGLLPALVPLQRLEVFAYVDTADWNEFLAIREDLYLRFIDAVRQAGTGFAFPSSTTYVGRDEGLRDEDARRAEARGAAWREKGALPFPEFPDEVRREVWNTLDWPPAGSSGGGEKREATP